MNERTKQEEAYEMLANAANAGKEALDELGLAITGALESLEAAGKAGAELGKKMRKWAETQVKQ